MSRKCHNILWYNSVDLLLMISIQEKEIRQFKLVITWSTFKWYGFVITKSPQLWCAYVIPRSTVIQQQCLYTKTASDTVIT